MRLSILGRLEVRRDDGAPVPVGGQRLRALLTALAAEPGRVVGADRLIGLLWGEAAPANAANALQALVYRLRGAIGRDAIEADPAGYRLVIAPDGVDAQRFAKLVAEARGAAPAVARVLLKEALALWRGPALAELDDSPGAARLEESRVLAVEDYAAACLADTDAAEALAVTARELDGYPLRERLAALHIGALHALGRQADALRRFEAVRRGLAEELGVDPSPELAALHLELLRGRSARRGNLPAQLTSFVGRDAELAAVAGLLADRRLVTLVGPGGAGKTRLAVEAAARLPDTDAWLIELAPVGDPADVARTVLTVLDVRDRVFSAAAMASPDPTGRLVDALSDRRLLLLFDNCEHVVDAAAGLVAAVLAGCPRVRVLATSREPLGVPGETLFPVPPLQLPAEPDRPAEARRTAAVRLFADRAAAVVPGFVLSDEDITAVGQICRRLDGMPLAIELAAARLRLLRPAQIAERIDDRFRLLTAGPRTVLPRHQTLRAVVDWSWDLLDEPERELAARLSVFAGGGTLESIQAVCGLDTLDPIAALVDKSLVEVASPERGRGPVVAGASTGPISSDRYRMLETIRAYAGERLAEWGRTDDARRVHAAHFLALAEQAVPLLRREGQREWADRLRAEHDNLAAALRYLVDAGDAAGALRLCGALCAYWLPFGFRSEATGWCTQTIALAPDGPPEGLRRAYAMCWVVDRLSRAGELLARPGELAAMAERTIGMLDEATAEGPLQPLLCFVRFIATLMSGRPHEAFTLLAGYLRADDPWLRHGALLGRGMLRLGTGRLRPAAADLARAAAGFREIGEFGGLGQALVALAELANLEGDSARALALIEEASALWQSASNGEDSHLLFARLAGARATTGDLAGARDELARARSALPAGSTPASAAHVLLVEADLARRSGDPGTAMAVYESLRTELSATVTEPGRQQRAMVSSLLARLVAERGDRARACDLLREALVILDDSPDVGILLQIVEGFLLIEDDPERVATMVGAAESVRGRWGPVNTARAKASEETVAAIGRARGGLGEDRYRAAHAAGRAMDRAALTAYLS